jgi:hypothetical protein
MARASYAAQISAKAALLRSGLLDATVSRSQLRLKSDRPLSERQTDQPIANSSRQIGT